MENPYFQYFCGEVVFRHEAPFDRSSLTRWRQRLGEEQIAALLRESLSVAHRTGAIESKDLERVVVDTTVQEKAIAHPTDARLTHRAIEKLVEMAKREGIETPELSARGQTRGHYGGALFAVPTSSSALGGNSNSCARDLAASSATFAARSRPDAARQDRFGPLLDLALLIRHQEQRQRGPKVYSWHAPEVECMGGGHGRRTSSAADLDCHASRPRPKADSSCCMPRRCMAIRTTATRSVPSSLISKSSQVLLSAASTATRAIAATTIPTRFRVWISGQVRRVTKVIRREMRRRAAVEPVIGHLYDHRMRRNYLKGRDGDRINAVLAAAGYNFSLLLRWFEELLRVLLLIICRSRAPQLLLG